MVFKELSIFEVAYMYKCRCRIAQAIRIHNAGDTDLVIEEGRYYQKNSMKGSYIIRFLLNINGNDSNEMKYNVEI